MRLGKTLKHCPQRQGRDYEQFLSQKTLLRRKKKEPCPKCGKLFERLDTHLHNSAICKTIQKPPPSQPQAHQAPPTPEDATCPASDIPSTLPSSEFQCCPTVVDLLPAVDLPRVGSEWDEADNFFRVYLVPRVCMEETVDAMNHALCKGIYDFFARQSNNKMPIKQHLHQHPFKVHHHHQRPVKECRHQRTLKAVKEEKREMKKRLRALRRNGGDPEEVHTLAHTSHQLVQRYNKLFQEAK